MLASLVFGGPSTLKNEGDFCIYFLGFFVCVCGGCLGLLNFNFYSFTFMCMGVFPACLCIMCVPSTYGGQKRHQITWDWSYRQL